MPFYVAFFCFICDFVVTLRFKVQLCYLLKQKKENNEYTKTTDEKTLHFCIIGSGMLSFSCRTKQT